MQKAIVSLLDDCSRKTSVLLCKWKRIQNLEDELAMHS